MARPPDKNIPMLTCPACSGQGHPTPRIGNRRTTCSTCNRYAARLRAAVANELKERHAKEVPTIQRQVAPVVYEDLLRSTGGEK